MTFPKYFNSFTVFNSIPSMEMDVCIKYFCCFAHQRTQSSSILGAVFKLLGGYYNVANVGYDALFKTFQ